jgi:hypothetical protein
MSHVPLTYLIKAPFTFFLVPLPSVLKRSKASLKDNSNLIKFISKIMDDIRFEDTAVDMLEDS